MRLNFSCKEGINVYHTEPQERWWHRIRANFLAYANYHRNNNPCILDVLVWCYMTYGPCNTKRSLPFILVKHHDYFVNLKFSWWVCSKHAFHGCNLSTSTGNENVVNLVCYEKSKSVVICSQFTQWNQYGLSRDDNLVCCNHRMLLTIIEKKDVISSMLYVSKCWVIMKKNNI